MQFFLPSKEAQDKVREGLRLITLRFRANAQTTDFRVHRDPPWPQVLNSVFVCAGCLRVKEKIPCAILVLLVFSIVSDVYTYEAMYLNTIKWMMCRGLVDRSFFLYTCFSPTIRPKYRAITRASVLHKARISVDSCGDVDGMIVERKGRLWRLQQWNVFWCVCFCF